jgi:hypothetical protein
MSLSITARRQRLHVRDANHAVLPRISKMLAAGLLHREIGQRVGLDRSRISQIVRAAKAAKTRFSDLEAS